MKKMTVFHGLYLFVFCFWVSMDGSCFAADILITEFQAKNNTTVSDKDGAYPDWIELFNAGDETVDLSGWFLTDDPADLTVWRIPAVDLNPGGFLLVFASNKDIRVPGEELHTNFKLTSGGEFLALVEPDGETIAWSYGDFPGEEPYPPQPTDFSYGLAMNGSMVNLVGIGADATAHVPQDGGLGMTWTDPDFDDSQWRAGQTGVGYETGSGYQQLINLDMEDVMDDINATVYIRVPFEVADPADIGGLVLRMQYDDGFIAYVNGERLAEMQAPATAEWDSSATADHTDSEAIIFQSFDIDLPPGLLRAGSNVLAIHGLNRGTGSSDMLIVPELVGFGAGELNRELVQFFDQPTPGFSNVAGYPRIATQPAIQPDGTVFMNSMNVTLSVADPATEIRYTLNGNEPNSNSTLYTGPITLTTSTMVRVKGFEAGIAPSPTVSMGYIRVAGDVQSFSSNLPLVLLDNFNGPDPVKEPKRPAFLALYEPGESGRTVVTGAPEIQSRIGIEIRGSSTAGRPKSSYSFEFWDEDDEDKNFKPLGFPEESDWILYGPYNFDRALMRNAFIYELSNQVGRYATRSTFVEVFFNMNGGDLAYSDYMGVYSFMEKIKRGEKRVDVERLSGDTTEEPGISGGYMLKIDRSDPGDSGFGTSRQGSIRYVYPKEDDITPAQSSWIRNYLQTFENALFGANFRDPELGYLPYVDVDSWVDHHMLNVLAMNVDALRLSTYFHKTRGGKIEYGPIWDFDRSMGSTDGRDDNPRQWHGPPDSSMYFDYDSRFPWWNRLFQDPDAMQRWKDRWHMFRQDEMSTANIFGVIDGMADALSEASIRNFERWGQVSPTPSAYQGQVNIMKNWLSTRASWIDDQFPDPPVFSAPGGRVQVGFEFSLSSASGTIYYTLDGSDPRDSGGGIRPEAMLYDGPIVLEGNARVVARARVSASNWSAPASETYVTDPSSLVITEIMYHPGEPPVGSPFEDNDYEFLELYNRGSEALDLSGLEFASGLTFAFPQGVSLLPDEYGVIVRNLGAFQERYPHWPSLKVFGQYEGSLENRGERLSLTGRMDEALLSFTYSDMWWPQTDGDGYSLVVLDVMDPRDPWGEKESWDPSGIIHGSPGQPNPGNSGTGGWQLPGDANQDGALDLSDAIQVLRLLFSAQAIPLPCDAPSIAEGGNLLLLDVNDSGSVDLADPLYILAYLFNQGSEPSLGTRCTLIEGCPTGCGF